MLWWTSEQRHRKPLWASCPWLHFLLQSIAYDILNIDRHTAWYCHIAFVFAEPCIRHIDANTRPLHYRSPCICPGNFNIQPNLLSFFFWRSQPKKFTSVTGWLLWNYKGQISVWSMFLNVFHVDTLKIATVPDWMFIAPPQHLIIWLNRGGWGVRGGGEGVWRGGGLTTVELL